MLFILHLNNLTRTLMARYSVRHVLVLALAMLAFNAHALSPSQIFEKVKDSVVVVKALDATGRTITQGSGVLLPSGKVGTNCHVVKNGVSFQAGGGGSGCQLEELRCTQQEILRPIGPVDKYLRLKDLIIL